MYGGDYLCSQTSMIVQASSVKTVVYVQTVFVDILATVQLALLVLRVKKVSTLLTCLNFCLHAAVCLCTVLEASYSASHHLQTMNP